MKKIAKMANVSFIKQTCLPEIKFQATMDLFNIHMQEMTVSVPQPTNPIAKFL